MENFLKIRNVHGRGNESAVKVLNKALRLRKVTCSVVDLYGSHWNMGVSLCE